MCVVLTSRRAMWRRSRAPRPERSGPRCQLLSPPALITRAPPPHTHTSHSEMMFMMSPNFGAAVGIESNLQITWHGTRVHRDSGVRFTTLVTHLTGKNQPAAQREPRLGGCAVKPLVVQAGALWAECFLSFSQGSESGLNLEHRVGFCEGACGGGGRRGRCLPRGP